MSLSAQRCIQPNPDIAGIGIRISIYAQSLAIVVQAILYAADGVLKVDERRRIRTSAVTLAITAFALSFAAIIQINTSGLSLYHALIVLNLSWVLIASALVGSIYHALNGVFEARSWGDVLNLLRPNDAKLPLIIFPTTHLLIIGSFGFWVWYKVDVIGNQPECTSETFTIIFGHNISVTNPTIRIVSILTYAIAIVPVVNVLGMVALTVGLSYIFPTLISVLLRGFEIGANTRARLHYYSALCIAVLLIITFIVDTELMIQRSNAMVFAGESQWSYGQTLSVVLLFPIIADVYVQIYMAVVELMMDEEEKMKRNQSAERRIAHELISTLIECHHSDVNIAAVDINDIVDRLIRELEDITSGLEPVSDGAADGLLMGASSAKNRTW